MESIQGLVEHIVYHNDTNGYTVFSLMCQGEEIVCVGNVTSLDEGEYLKAEGEYTEHQVYGRQFKVTSMSVEVPEDEYSIERYLGSGAIRGVGPSLAARIVKKFKKDSFRIIEEEPERLAEIKGISERKAREIYQQFHEKQDMRQAMMFLAKYGITTTLSLRIYKQYGEEMYRIIQENPYRLADDMNGIGFKLADEIAKKAGIGSHSDFRIRSGIIYMLQQGTLSGHIYIPAALLVEKTAQMLGVEEEAVDHLLQSLQMDRKIVVKKIDDVSVVYGASLYRLELETAGLLKNLGVDYSVDEKEVGKVLDRIEKREGIDLDDHQREAVYSAAGNGVLVITGGPGTGKTTTINILSGYLQPHSGECRIFGENIRNMNPQTRQRMALLIEGHVQYTFMTIKEIERFYSAFFPAWNKDAYYELMHKLKVAPGQKISRMSCGQRSQVALGLILAQNAELLVLDDFSLGLDPGYRRLFIEYLKEYAKAESKTIFLTSHIIQDMERLIDDCIIMDYGKILIQKPVNELLNTFTRYRFTTGSGEVQLPADSQLYNTSVIRGHAETYSFQDMEYVKQWLEQNGIPHTSLSAEKMNLEDVFIGLTGKY